MPKRQTKAIAKTKGKLTVIKEEDLGLPFKLSEVTDPKTRSLITNMKVGPLSSTRKYAIKKEKQKSKPKPKQVKKNKVPAKTREPTHQPQPNQEE